MAPSSGLGPRLRVADPDRYFCTLFAPAAQREALFLLYSFNHELARAREVAREPMLALIRLNWWREVVEGAARAHEVATPLGAALQAGIFDRGDLLRLVEAREVEAEPEIADATGFFAYARGTAGRLAWLAGKLLGVESTAVEDLGTAYGIAGILRAAPFLRGQGRSLLPADGTPVTVLVAEARRLLGAQAPRSAWPAALPAVYARRDLGGEFRPRGLADRLAVLRAAVTGRI